MSRAEATTRQVSQVHEQQVALTDSCPRRVGAARYQRHLTARRFSRETREHLVLIIVFGLPLADNDVILGRH